MDVKMTSAHLRREITENRYYISCRLLIFSIFNKFEFCFYIKLLATTKTTETTTSQTTVTQTTTSTITSVTATTTTTSVTTTTTTTTTSVTTTTTTTSVTTTTATTTTTVRPVICPSALWHPNATTAAGSSSGTGGSTSSLLAGAYDVRVDSALNVYVADYSNYRYMKWSPNSRNGTVIGPQSGMGGSSKHTASEYSHNSMFRFDRIKFVSIRYIQLSYSKIEYSVRQYDSCYWSRMW